MRNMHLMHTTENTCLDMQENSSAVIFPPCLKQIFGRIKGVYAV